MTRTRFFGLLGLAALLTLLNALKPLHIDDTAYYYYAAHIAEHPLDPYGFEVYWSDRPQPANHVLAPPVLPYWWAAGLRLFGDRPLLWKLWLFPVSVLLVFAMHRLLCRFARGLEWPLLAMTVLSPTLLPSFNLMLDVPALALGLMALALFVGAVRNDSGRQAVLAGLIAGIGTETKYTAFLVPCVLLHYAGVYRRPRLGLIAAATTGACFAAWETAVALRYGESHFLYHWRHGPNGFGRLLHLTPPLVGILGGAAPAVGLLALAALRAPRRAVIGLGVLLGVGYLLLACVPEAEAVFLRDPASGKPRLTLNNLLVGPAGLLVCGAVAAVAAGLRPLRWPRGRADRFLVLWLALELAGYYALTPYAATRRVLGVTLVATLLAGRLAAVTCRAAPRRWLVHGCVAASVALGLAFYAADYRDALAARRAVEEAVRWVRQREPETPIWYAGHWGFQFYAERAGLKPVFKDDPRPRPGDWLVLPDPRMALRPCPIDVECAEESATVGATDRFGLRVSPSYYSGNTALEHQEGPRFEAHVYRLTADALRRQVRE